MLNLGDKPYKTPTPKYLCENAGEPITAANGIVLYANGYAVYNNGSGRTVVWLPECQSFTYNFVKPRESEIGNVPEKTALPDELLSSQPWVIAVTLIGDHRVDDNIMKRMEGRIESLDSKRVENEDGAVADEAEKAYREEYSWREGYIGEDPLDAVIRKEREQELLACMTEKQREVFIMYYKYGYTQQEIADRLEIARTTVQHHLDDLIKKVKKVII